MFAKKLDLEELEKRVSFIENEAKSVGLRLSETEETTK
jgi:hypothetical protein